MFETLKGKLQTVFEGLAKRGALSQADVDDALREVRLALLDADVALPVVKSFIEKLRNEAVGVASLRSVRPDQQVIKIVHDALIEMLGGDAATLPPGSSEDAAGGSPSNPSRGSGSSGFFFGARLDLPGSLECGKSVLLPNLHFGQDQAISAGMIY